MEALATRTCPQCSAQLPVLDGFPDWCEHCGWNLQPPPAPRWGYGARFDAIMGRVGRGTGERMSRALLARRDLRPHWTPGRVLAYALALAVIALSFGLMAAGIAAVVASPLNALVLLIAATLFGVGWLLRPRLGRLDLSHEVTAEQAPELHALVAQVAAALSARAPDHILLEPQYNAWWSVIGVRRRRVLMLGTGLLVVLEPDELVALIGHELSHEANGDPRDGLIVGTAAAGLADLHALMDPGPYAESLGVDDATDLAAMVARPLMRLLGLPVLGLALLESHLLQHDARRAEYLADARAAEVAGTAAVVRLHERLLAWGTYQLAVQHAAHESATAGLFVRLREAFVRLPERERARQRAVARLEQTQLHATHPPTAMRIALLEGRAPVSPAVTVDRLRADRIRGELEALEPRLGPELLDRYRSSLYYG